MTMCLLCQLQDSHADCGRRQAAVYHAAGRDDSHNLCIQSCWLSQQKLIIRGYFNNNSNVNALQFMARQVCAGHVLAYFEHPDKTAMAMTALSRPM